MKRILTTLLTLSAAVLLPGCLQNETTVHLNKDGSGTLVEQTTLGAQALAMMEQFAAIGGDPGADPLSETFSEEKAKARAKELGEGVTFVKSERLADGPNKGARVTYRFADINTLRLTPGANLRDMSPGAAAVPDPKERPVTFSYADGKLTIDMPDPDKTVPRPEGANPAENPQMEAMMKEMLRDMKMSLKLVVDAGVAETDATYHDGNTITLVDMEMNRVLEKPEVLGKLMTADQKDPAASMELLKGVEGVKMETKDKVSVTVK